MMTLGFQMINGDHTLFLSILPDAFLIILVYVDDIVIASNIEIAVSRFIVQLQDSSSYVIWDN